MADNAQDTISTDLAQAWEERGIVADTLRVNSRGTLVPDDASDDDDLLDYALPTLLGGDDGSTGELQLRTVIGKGGMGVVSLAYQKPLRRDVAVKTIREGVDRVAATQQLLREAWVTGLLEHPNVVPVHALGRDETDAPVMVMKRIEGTSWRTFLDHPERPRPSTNLSPLEWHLHLLKQVCNAIEFAHSKAILHRDLKPDNVMIGEYGEVYVLDWGIAVSLSPEAPAEIPKAWEVTHVAGTPAYMAPEMVLGEGARLSERTDIYQLGAILHEVITGEKRHGDDNVIDALASAFASKEPDYGPEVPSELAEICQRSMAADPTERYPDVASMRRAIDDFLHHQDSLGLTAEALARLETLQGLLRSNEAAKKETRSAIYGLFNACRFGFEHALQTWAENEQAQEGFQTAVEHMIHYELEHGSLGAARNLLEELPSAHPRLERLLQELGTNGDLISRDELVKLRAMEHEQNPDVGMRTRSLLALSNAVLWAVAHSLCGVATRTGYYDIGYVEYMVLVLAYGLQIAIGTYLWRNTLLGTAVNRRIVAALMTSFLGMAALVPAGALLALPFEKTLSLVPLVCSLAGVMVTATVDNRMIWFPIAFLGAFGIAIAAPNWVFECIAAAGFIGFINAAAVWRGAPKDLETIEREEALKSLRDL